MNKNPFEKETKDTEDLKISSQNIYSAYISAWRVVKINLSYKTKMIEFLHFHLFYIGFYISMNSQWLSGNWIYPGF